MTDSYPFTVFGGEFKGKRVLVTGGTKGVGEAIVRRFALSGASVATTARSEAAHGQDSTLFIRADIGTARGVQNVVDHIQPITTVKTTWKTTLKNAKVAHFPIYHLRHVFCTRLSWVAPDAVVQRAMRHSSPETKRHYQLGMVEQVRQNLEKANEKVYGKGKVLRFHDGQPAAGTEEEMAVSK